MIKVIKLPAKYRKCVMRRHRVGIVKKCNYICTEEKLVNLSIEK